MRSSPSCTSISDRATRRGRLRPFGAAPWAARIVAAAALLSLPASPARADGAADYRRLCASCHGARGDGAGPAAGLLEPRPRDFTTGAYKFRSTPSGALPTDTDLLAVITEGLRGTSMTGFRSVLPWARRRALVDVVKGFSPRFRTEPIPPPLRLPPAPPVDAGTLARGRAVYQRMQCAECHGRGARGDGPSVPTLVDDTGRSIVPSDLTRRDMVRRRSPWGMMRVMYTGLNGTPMPSYADTITPAESWDLVRWLVSLQGCRPFAAFFLDPPLTWRADR